MTISLSAYVTLICLYSPKLYIIILHPEKNVRSDDYHFHPRLKIFWKMAIKTVKKLLTQAIIMLMMDQYVEISFRKLTMNTVKRPTVLAAAMPLMAATTVDSSLCKGPRS